MATGSCGVWWRCCQSRRGVREECRGLAGVGASAGPMFTGEDGGADEEDVGDL